MEKMRIYVMAHKQFDKPENPIYQPMQVGSSLHDDLGYLRDDSGDNISAKNPFYNELTGLYWMWKNDVEHEVIGLCHYRRYFLNRDGELLSAHEIENILENADVIVSNRLVCKDSTIYASYVEKHKEQDLEKTKQAIEKLCPEYLDCYNLVMNGHEMYYGNLIIAKSSVVKEYAQWLFSILEYAEMHMDYTGYNDYDKRVYGFIAERLLMVWIQYHQLRVCENEVGLIGEKSESSELLGQVERLLVANNTNAAYQVLYEANEKRPDLFFKDSDVTGKLAKIYRIMEISRLEEKNGRTNILHISQKIDELIRHYDHILGCLDRMTLNSEFFEYVVDKEVSVETIMVLMGTMELSKEERIRIFNFFANEYLNIKNLNMAKLYVGLAFGQE